jgi:antirestriction protein
MSHGSLTERGAPEVRIAARHRELQLALIDAVEKWQETGDLDDLCKVAAQRALDEYEAKLELLAELRRSLAEKRAAAAARKKLRLLGISVGEL